MQLKRSVFIRHFVVFIAGLFLWLANASLSVAEDSPPTTPYGYRFGELLEEKEKPAPSDSDLFHFDQDRWNEMRKELEGEVIAPTKAEKVDVSTVTAEPPKPPPGIINVELPYESSLSITGRKIIKVNVTNTHISKERANELGTKQDTQTFEMEQELQARIQGTVARKTTINVNFDDTKENVKDFSVVYKGDPDEVVQEAAFGDIVLSLPSTEFVNYNKQLFGIRTALKYKRFGLMAIGSRTKGTTETKRFTGQTTRQQIFVNDTAYIRRRFYDLTFSTSSAMTSGPLSGQAILPISDAVAEVVFIEDTTGLIPFPQAQDFTVASPTAPATSTTIRMRQLSRGVDYSIDRLEGILIFNSALPEDVRVAVNYTLANGQRLSDLVGGGVDAVLIKDRNPETPGVSQEIKRFYSTGARNIVPDNGLGNFILRVFDKNRETEIGNTLSPLQKYPDTIEMRFETGIFELDNLLPFGDIYTQNVNTASPLHAVFSVEFQSILRTYVLRPNIVLQSETVEVNGRRLSRDLDYFIDYDIGIITFFNEDLIRESTTIEITYEFAPFGGQLGETLVGARGTMDLLTNQSIGGVGLENWSVGSTVLYNFAAKPQAPPDVRSTPSSLLVTEGDTSIKGLKFGKIPISSNFSIESARSTQDPNLFGRALIDSMEGIKQEDASPLLEDAWQVASVPPLSGYNSVTDFRGRVVSASHLRWSEGDIFTSDPLDDAGATQKALTIVYNLNTENAVIQEQASLVNVISVSGRDFSKKTTLEVELEGAGANGSGVDMIVEYGSFNEDSDGDGILDTEDEIPFDGLLNLGEDIGWVFNGPGPNLTKDGGGDDTAIGVGDANTRLDAEDLNGDRVLSTQDFPATFNPLFKLSDGHIDSNSAFANDLSFSNRRLFQIPLNISGRSDEEKARLTAVRQVRITFRNLNPATTPQSGSVNLIRLSVVGNTYEPATISGSLISTMTVRAINSKDDLGVYTSLIGNPDYADLYKTATPSIETREQALALDYDLVSGSSATTKNQFSAPRDFSDHEEFRYFLSQRSPGCTTDCGELFFQVGSETEYQQASINIANIPISPIWMTVKIRQKDLNQDGTLDTWETLTPNVTITRVRPDSAPNLSGVSQIKIGVLNNTGVSIQNQVWVNEIHLKEPKKRNGSAQKATFDSTWAGWMDFGASEREVDRNWQTPTTAITNQDNLNTNAYVNFNRLSFFPVTYRTTKEETVTPSAFRANQNALVSFLEEGKVEKETHASTAKLILPKLPVFDFTYNTDKTENNLTQRTESNEIWTAGATYSLPWKPDLLPGKSFTFRLLPNSITYLHTSKTSDLRFPDNPNDLISHNVSTAPFSSTDLTQISQENEIRLAFRPWDTFTFNPAYRLKVDKEKRFFRPDEKTSLPAVLDLDNRETPRSTAQTITASGNIKLLKWLDPRYNYSFTGSETNGLPTQTNTTAYALKTITRNSQGEVSGNIQVTQIFPGSKLLRSMNFNNSYKLENGDSYNDMPEGFSWRSKLWVGNPLAVSTGTTARRVEATDRRTFRTNNSWQPFSAYGISSKRYKPLSTLSLSSNYLSSIEDSESNGAGKHVESLTFPDLILTINDTEDFFDIKRAIDNSRIVFKTNKRKTETRAVSRSLATSWGTDYQFQFLKKLDFSTTFNLSNTREDNLVTNQLTSETDVRSYSIQTRVPWNSWAFTPRYERNETDAKNSVQVTNDLVAEVLSVQIYGDISKPLGIRLGRKEIGLANRFILNSTVKWDKKRSSINPSTNYLDTYSATMSGDYTISQNFRLAVGGDFSQEKHHPDFKKLDKVTFGINSTLTIQF